MVSKELIIKNKYGIHARPARLIVEAAGKFKSDIYVAKNGEEMNAKSIMGILMLEAKKGSTLEIRADGEDEQEAIEAMTKVFAEIAELKENL